MIEQKLLGTTLISVSEFKNESDEIIVPTAVNIKYKKPNNVIDVVPVAVGINNKFTANVLLDVPGTWWFRWESVSGNTVAEEFTIVVLDTQVK